MSACSNSSIDTSRATSSPPLAPVSRRLRPASPFGSSAFVVFVRSNASNVVDRTRICCASPRQLQAPPVCVRPPERPPPRPPNARRLTHAQTERRRRTNRAEARRGKVTKVRLHACLAWAQDVGTDHALRKRRKRVRRNGCRLDRRACWGLAGGWRGARGAAMAEMHCGNAHLSKSRIA